MDGRGGGLCNARESEDGRQPTQRRLPVVSEARRSTCRSRSFVCTSTYSMTGENLGRASERFVVKQRVCAAPTFRVPGKGHQRQQRRSHRRCVKSSRSQFVDPT